MEFTAKIQLHISALDNDHLQVEKMKKNLSKQLYWICVGSTQWGDKR